MFNKKKIELLEARVALLEARAEAMEFKEKAKGATYIVSDTGYYGDNNTLSLILHKNVSFHGWHYTYKISYLSKRGDKVITKEFEETEYYRARQNDKYLEFWQGSEINCVMYLEDDDLVKMNIDVYKKAFADRIKAIKHVAEVKAGAEQATAAFEQMTSAVEQFKNTAG